MKNKYLKTGVIALCAIFLIYLVANIDDVIRGFLDTFKDGAGVE